MENVGALAALLLSPGGVYRCHVLTAGVIMLTLRNASIFLFPQTF